MATADGLIYLVFHELRHFRGHIGIGDARLGGLQVFGLDGKIGHGVFQSVLHGSECGRATLSLFDDGVVYPAMGLLRLILRFDGNDVALREDRGMDWG